MLDAACAGMDLADFAYTEVGDPGYEARRLESGKWAKERESNRIRLEEARETCLTCSAKDECYESATDSDRYWTVRGGVMPGVFKPRPRWVPSADMKPYLPDPCPAGHLGAWKPRPNGGRDCKMCQDDYREANARD